MKKVDNLERIAEEWFSLGSTLLLNDKFEEALQAFDKVIKLDPNHPDVWNAKARALTALSRNEEAKECFKNLENFTYQKNDEEEKVVQQKGLEIELINHLGIVDEAISPNDMIEDYIEFECPICGNIVGEDDTHCSNCFIKFGDEEDIPDGMEVGIDIVLKELEEELERFVSEEIELIEDFQEQSILFECPACGRNLRITIE